MKRWMAFALALVLVFGAGLALYEPERTDAAGDSADGVWVGYFFSLAPFEGRLWAEKTDDGYDFGVPGVPLFLTVTEIRPGESGYTEGSAFNYVVGEAASDEVDSRGMHVYANDDGSCYEIDGDINLDAQKRVALLYECYVYRTGAGAYYAECRTVNGMKSAYSGPGFGLSQTRSVELSDRWTVNGKEQSQSVKVSVSLVESIAMEEGRFVWMDGEKNVLAREEYAAGDLPETLTAPEGAALLVVTKTLRGADGAPSTAREVHTPSDEDARVRLLVPSPLEGLLARRVIALDWGDTGA